VKRLVFRNEGISVRVLVLGIQQSGMSV
jgi:hypothetical protein